MKCTWPTPEDPTPPIFHWLASGVWRRVTQKKKHQLTQNIPTCWYILRWVTQNAGVGGIAQRQPPTPGICVLVEYRLMGTFSDPQHTHPGILYWSRPPGVHHYGQAILSGTFNSISSHSRVVSTDLPISISMEKLNLGIQILVKTPLICYCSTAYAKMPGLLDPRIVYPLWPPAPLIILLRC